MVARVNDAVGARLERVFSPSGQEQLAALLTAAARATIVHIDGNGPQAQNNPEQSRKATYVNQLSAGDCNLYWVGAFKRGPRLFYGPLAANGGERTIEGFPGQVFALTRAGTYETLAEYTISDGSGGGGSGERFTLTDADVLASTRRQRLK